MPELDELLDLFTPKQTARGYHPFVTTLPSRQAPKTSPYYKSRFVSRPAKTPSIKPNNNGFFRPQAFYFQKPLTISVQPPKSHSSPCRPQCMVVPDCLFLFLSLFFFTVRLREDDREDCSEPARGEFEEQKE